MDVLVPLPVALPLLAAAFLTAFARPCARFLGRRFDDLLAIAVAAATAVICVLLVFRSADHGLLYWFGGWTPRDGVALGISFDVEPSSAALAALAAALATATFVFAWRYFDEVGTLFHVLMLVFLGAMCGFALTGDIFNLFVFFELMSVAAFALVGYRSEEAGPRQGAINFAVTNTVGAFLILTGIALLYGRTGALNLEQIGRALGRETDGLVVVSFVLLVGGFLVKSGAVPFHFWLSDAYAAAPIPVCVLLSGVMSDLGLHAITRIYWPVFSDPFAGRADSVRGVLIAVAVLTALLGGLMAFFQRDLKRMLAYVTIGNIGSFLAGIALLTPRGLAGTTIFVLADGVLRGALFLAVGIFVRRLGTGDELELRGRGGEAPVAAGVFAAAALTLAALPPFGPFWGQALVVDSARELGYGWLPPLLALATILASGTLLRAAARIALGVGHAEDPLLSVEPAEAREEPERASRVSPIVLFAPAVVLALAGIGLGVVPDLADWAIEHAARLQDEPAALGYGPSAAAYLYGAVSSAGALAFAAFGLYRRRLPMLIRRLAGPPAGPVVAGLKALHGGAVGDYVTWIVTGTAVLGGVCALVLT
jgi:multicomponent Na+:H+ antiporter subunit D